MVVERTADEVVVRIPVSPQTVERVQDMLEIAAITPIPQTSTSTANVKGSN